MSRSQNATIELVKQSVSTRLQEVAHGWHAQSKMNLSETEYSDGYASGQDACADQLFEIIEELMDDIDGACQGQTNKEVNE